MLAMEEILCELGGDHDMNEQGLPPGFRFHPTDEELITFYLASKVSNGSFCGVQIAEVDLNRCEPWELPDVAKMGDREWYFFSLRDRKYPTGLRTNRATCAGYWKATGKDREVYSASNGYGALVGMKKTLVFYKGRAPRGEKTKWVMHEYRLDGDFFHRHTCKEEWVICRIFHKVGDKKNPLLQGHESHRMIKACSSPTLTACGLLPPLLEAPTEGILQSLQIQNPLQESDLKSVINHPALSQFSLLPLSGPLTYTPNANTITTSADKDGSTSQHSSPTTTLFKSILAQQICTLKGVTNTNTNTNAISKQYCKTEQVSFSHCQSSNDNMSWPNHSTTNYQSPAVTPTPLSLWADFHHVMGMGIPSGATYNPGTDTSICEMSIPVTFSSRAGFQMPVHPQPQPSSEVPGDSWPSYY